MRFTAIIPAIAFLASTLAEASVIIARQGAGELANCIFSLTPTGTPNGFPLDTEFNIIFSVKISDENSSGVLTGPGASVSGPDAGGVYTVQKSTGAVGLSTSDNRVYLLGWTGQTLTGENSGVDWFVNAVQCSSNLEGRGGGCSPGSLCSYRRAPRRVCEREAGGCVPTLD